MGYPAQNLRELMSLARMLREFAHAHADENRHDLFLSAAVELEARAHLIATTNDVADKDLLRDSALHAPVNCLV
jgi:hypothetical protein